MPVRSFDKLSLTGQAIDTNCANGKMVVLPMAGRADGICGTGNANDPKKIATFPRAG